VTQHAAYLSSLYLLTDISVPTDSNTQMSRNFPPHTNQLLQIQYAPKYTILKCIQDVRVSVLYILAHTVLTQSLQSSLNKKACISVCLRLCKQHQCISEHGYLYWKFPSESNFKWHIMFCFHTSIHVIILCIWGLLQALVNAVLNLWVS
jgi:hypothetical protein